MKNLLAILLLFVGVSFVSAQGDQQKPVKVETSVSKSGDELIVTINLKVEDDWIVYDSLDGDVGPIPISFDHDLLQNLELIKIKKPKTKHKFDDVFEVDLWYFAHEAIYELQYKITDKSFDPAGSLSMEYMCCNLTSGVCLPPKLIDVEVGN